MIKKKKPQRKVRRSGRAFCSASLSSQFPGEAFSFRGPFTAHSQRGVEASLSVVSDDGLDLFSPGRGCLRQPVWRTPEQQCSVGRRGLWGWGA